jgi:phosphoglycolate phosphatase
MNILIDLDGTLLDSRERLYFLFKSLVPECDLDIKAYWNLKRSKVTHQKILTTRYRYTDTQIENFEKAWMNLIEEKRYLDKDVPFTGVGEHLQKLQKDADLFLLTSRQRPEMVEYQLDQSGLRNFFKDVYVTGGKIPKDEAISTLLFSSNDWIVGDTGHDIEVGRRLGIQTASVTNGFLNKNSLLEYGPDLIVEKFTDFKYE